MMSRMTLAAVAAFWTIGASPCISDDTGAGRAKLSVKCVLSPSEVIRAKSEKVVIEEGVETSFGIVSTITSDRGLRGSIESIHVFIPRIGFTRKADDSKKSEAIPVGPQLKLRVDKAANDKLLLDVTLSDTVVKKHSPESHTFDAVTTQVRSVQQVGEGETISLSWPVRERETEQRQVQISVSQVK